MTNDPIPREAGDSSPAAKTSGGGTPKFGRLLLVLLLAVIAIVIITFASEAYYS